MRALLLAAGQGRRLLPYTLEIPKSLVTVDERGEVSILQYQIEKLLKFGVRDICVVVGYKSEKIKELVGEISSIIENPEFSNTNSIYSAFLALDFMKEDVLIINADVLFHEEILYKVIKSDYDAVITIDSGAILDEEAMKVCVASDVVVDIRKDMPFSKAYGENVGIVRFKGSALELLKNCIERVVKEEGKNLWFPAALRRFIKERPLYYIDVKGMPWVEVDYLEDLEKAKKIFRILK